ncbi:MAG: hypothetical protein ACYTG0_24425 [Planctomycetota bacterium]|jgi:hypothetical protein
MIENEVLDIMSGTGDPGERLNSLTDQFREGRDSSELLTLLYSNDNELVRIGAWMIGELGFQRYNTHSFISRLWELTDHEVPAIRFHALGALYPTLEPEKSATRALLSKMRRDPNEGVRLRAQAAARRLCLQ